jgi:hypothetical protein
MAAQTYNILFKNGRTTEVAGVQSETVVHEENYTGRNYRDNMDLLLVPKASLNVGAEPFNPTTSTTPTAPTNAPTGDLSDGIIQTGSTNYYSISDVAAKIPPRHELNKRSRLKLWSQTAGGGDCLFAGFLDQIVSYSIGEYGRA